MSPTSPRQPGFGAGGQRQHAAAAAATTPFKIHRDSHLIHKGAAAGASASSPPSSSSTNSSVSSSPGVGQQRPAPRPQQQQQPVIIYTHSPKVIRTSPRDFMSIVQKLTGLESSAAAASAVTGTAQDESSSSSTESCANAHAGPAPPPPPQYMDPPQLMPPPAQLDHAHFMPDIPLFAPAGASEHQQHLLCASGGGLYGHFPPTMDAGSLGGQANIHDGAASGVVFSPSMVEAMRTAYPDYQLT